MSSTKLLLRELCLVDGSDLVIFIASDEVKADSYIVEMVIVFVLFCA